MLKASMEEFEAQRNSFKSWPGYAWGVGHGVSELPFRAMIGRRECGVYVFGNKNDPVPSIRAASLNEP